MYNTLKTTVLLATITALFMAVGNLIGGQGGMATALLVAIAMNVGTYWFSDKIVLKLHRATEVTPESHPEMIKMVKRLTERGNLPMPKVYIIPDHSPNAFATGRDPNHSAIAFSQGIIDLLNPDELSAVAAHELGHIKNRDILIGTIAACFAGAISMLANIAQWGMLFGRNNDRDENPAGTLVAIIVAPLAAMLIQMAISRSREYIADETGGKLHGNPLDLASALRKIHHGVEQIPSETATPAMSHMYILSPFSGRGLIHLFSTHPPVEERIERLEQQAQLR
ncbi:protease HtpX [bacterium]|nr:protease HtpX [bacterium]